MPPESLAVDATVELRAMTVRELHFAALLHQRLLPHGLFPLLGLRFLSAYLETFISSPVGIAVVARRRGLPVGFVVGTTDDPSHYHFVTRRRGLRLGRLGLVALVARPAVARWFLRTRLRRYAIGVLRLARSAPTEQPSSSSSAEAVLSHLAVDPASWEEGVGGALLAAFINGVEARGANSVRLLTRAGRDGAGEFYERWGWAQSHTFVDADGVAWTQYRRALH